VRSYHDWAIVIVWALGRAQGFMLPVTDAAVLFTVMIGGAGSYLDQQLAVAGTRRDLR
jgi:hypothetical protein